MQGLRYVGSSRFPLIVMVGQHRRIIRPHSSIACVIMSDLWDARLQANQRGADTRATLPSLQWVRVE